MNKIPEDELANYIKKYNLCHFKKVNLIGASNVGKKTLLSYIEYYSEKAIGYEFKEKTENIKKDNPFLVELIKRMSITYNETKRLDINLYITNIDELNLDLIKDNIETLLLNSECIIFMIDISSSDSFALISELMPLMYSGRLIDN